MTNLSRVDYICLAIDQGLRTLFKLPSANSRGNPAQGQAEANLNDNEQKEAAALRLAAVQNIWGHKEKKAS